MNPERNEFRKEQDLIRRCRFWAAVIHNPADFYTDAGTHPYVAARYRASARRNLSKLFKRYPQLEKRLAAEHPEQVTQ